MTLISPALRTRLLLGPALLAVPLLAGAAAPEMGHSGGCESGFHQGPPGPPMDGPPGHDLDDRPPPFLHGLKLTDEQQDKVFNILHAASPALREQSKAVHKAREGLRELTHSAQFTTDAAMSLAQSQGKAESQLAFLRTKVEHEVYSVLTPEQQANLQKRRQEMDGHRDEGPPHG